MKALIIKKEWLNKIFFEKKIWEMRTQCTKVRGTIYLIEAGSGLIRGECQLIDSFKVSPEDIIINKDKHQVDDLKLLKKWNCAWVLSDIIVYDKPIPYKHPQGAVIWVNL